MISGRVNIICTPLVLVSSWDSRRRRSKSLCIRNRLLLTKSQPVVVDGEKKKRKRTRKQPSVGDKPAKRQAGAGAGAE